MDNFITLTCPTCGGKLQITDDIERFACAHCGNEHIVKRGNGTISLQPVVEGLNKVQIGVDKTASELAIKRLQIEINQIIAQRDQVKAKFTSNFILAGMWPIFIPLSMTLFCFIMNLTSYLDESIQWNIFTLMPCIFGVITIIVVVVVIIVYQRMKKKEAKNWQDYEILISKKVEELRYHQNIVDRI